MKEEHDSKSVYCRKLGHGLKFGYCREVNDGLPCFKVQDCWFEIFAVQEYLCEHYTKEELVKGLAPPPTKMEALLDIVSMIKKRNE